MGLRKRRVKAAKGSPAAPIIQKKTKKYLVFGISVLFFFFYLRSFFLAGSNEISYPRIVLSFMIL